MGAYTSAIVAVVATVATTATSFAVMAEEDQKKRLAEEAAANLMEKASKKLDVNYYEQLSIEKEAYEVARRNLLAQGATATETLREGDPRALAAGVGRVQLAQQIGQEKVSLAQQQEQSQLDKLVAGEDSRLRDLQTQLDLQGAIGAQQASADAERASQMALQQGMAGVVAVGGQVAGMADLYAKTPDVKAANRILRQAKRNNIDTSTLNMADPDSLKALGIKLTPKQWGAISKSGVSTFAEYQNYVTPKYNQVSKNKLGYPEAEEYIEPVVTPAKSVFSVLNNPFMPSGQPAFQQPYDPINDPYRSLYRGYTPQPTKQPYNYLDPFGYLYR
jgi:hypothetical protein